MMRLKDNIRLEAIQYVGALQYHGEPFLALYADDEYGQLYFMLRVNAESDDPDYLVYEIRKEDVERYMLEQCDLSQIIDGKSCWHLIVKDQRFVESGGPILDLPEAIEDVNVFDPEFCYDEYWIKTFLENFKEQAQLVELDSDKYYYPVSYTKGRDNNRKEYGY